ncbi:DUF721 domain-containing protein [Marinospirillum insulare]|uniref:DUF721 domain-containing protein n=1 Tax=Marinospirillum insulare TaxID=217169 RepID=A0ABQ5ZUP6_9GAMM|nr:DciA family protein [Marinospirillum insulare]GLR63137.1 hypothetical protein GCM10007878_05720 [Marinospirillum insulare]
MSIKPRAGRTKSLSAIINKDTSILGQVLNKAAYLKQIETLVHNYLPKELASQFRVANFQNNRLALITPTASNLTHLRFFQAKLLYDLQQKIPELKSIDVKVRPNPPEPKKVFKKLNIPANSQNQLKLLAETTDNPQLKAVLLRLSQK